MPSTRSSAKQNSSQAGSSPATDAKAGTKRKAEDVSSPSRTKSKRGRPAKEQKTLEESMPADDSIAAELADDSKTDAADSKAQDVSSKSNGHAEQSNSDKKDDVDEKMEDADAHDEKSSSDKKSDEKPTSEEKSNEHNGEKASTNGHNNTANEAKSDDKENVDSSKTPNAQDESYAKSKDAPTNGDAKADAVEEDKERAAAMPSNVLEKGIIHFFTRGRVGVDSADSVQDIARSYFVLRPLPVGAKLTDGTIPDNKNNRLFALPKKVWPKSGADKFMAFVEKARTDMPTLKEEFFSGSSYSTKTTGVSQTPEMTPLGEGVYAITTTGGGQGTTHLVYMLTIPAEISEVQRDMGLSAKGSFALSLKNPEAPGPANAQLPQGPEWPREFFDEFRGRGWMPVQPKHLDYANAQILLIGEDFESSHNLEPAAKDEKSGEEKETPQEELEKLEEEDEHRVQRLGGDDAVFADLGISSKEYPKVMTTW